MISTKKVLIIDCQTTGTHPQKSHLLQIGWGVFDPKDEQPISIEKWFLKPPTHYRIPDNILAMQKITDVELETALDPSIVFDKLQKVLNTLGQDPIVIAHYAQFERSFLKAFYLTHLQTDQLDFELMCSQRIAKRLLPNLPSHNLKALAGFLKCHMTPKNEVASHVTMTTQVWKHLMSKFVEMNIKDYQGIRAWLLVKPKTPVLNFYEYNIDKFSRLNLPTSPGIYRMLAEDKTVLYIGKATSLKSRVNSYFRGIKKRNRRTMEMLAQVWDIETVECPTPLEAALLESDEIKKWNPAYNILLKSDARKLLFYDKEYRQCSEIKDDIFCNGPYRPYGSVISFVIFLNGITNKHATDVFNEKVSSEVMETGWRIFCDQFGLLQGMNYSVRSFFVIAYQLLKGFEKKHGKGMFEKWWLEEKKQNPEDGLSPEKKIAQKISRLFLRAAETKRKSRNLHRLFNSKLLITSTKRRMQVVNGNIYWDPDHGAAHHLPNAGSQFDIHHYDRLSILLSAWHKKMVIFIHD